MSEGSLEAPERRPLGWREADFWDEAGLDTELRRVFDICHGCRRCFNLCDSFPRLFDLIDESPSQELDTVESAKFGEVVEACTMCDMCFMTKCPYVPPHAFDVDFPHLMVRARAVAAKKKGVSWRHRLLARTDFNGVWGGRMAGLINGLMGMGWVRRLARLVMGIDLQARMPKFQRVRFPAWAKKEKPPQVEKAKWRAVLYPGCHVNNHTPRVGVAAMRFMRSLGVEVATSYAGCCGMPSWEGGQVEKVATAARRVAVALRAQVDEGWKVVVPTASCGLMMKTEWPLLEPEDENIAALAQAVCDVDEYIAMVAKEEGVPKGLEAARVGVEKVAVHMACHARAQNIGAKAVEVLGWVEGLEVEKVERCSGHGGTFGVLEPTAAVARKVGAAAARRVKAACGEEGGGCVVSECPLAAGHLAQMVGGGTVSMHPVELLAEAGGLLEDYPRP